MNDAKQRSPFICTIIGFTFYLFFVPALLFIAAGTLDWPMAWVYVILLLGSTIGSRLIVWKRNPDTLRERARFKSSTGTKAWDQFLVMVVGLYGPMATFIVAGLDHRYAWSANIPEPIPCLAALVVAVGYGLGVWAMVVNRYFSAVARIQKDRQQVVVTEGPYRIMRHPAYIGVLLAALALPFMLEAIWALIPALILAVAIVIRTGLEDRILREELEGYEDYTRETTHRLFPGLW